MHKKASIFLAMFFMLYSAWAQQGTVAENLPFYRAKSVSLIPQATITIQDFNFSSFAIETYSLNDFQGLKVRVNGSEFHLKPNLELDRIISLLHIVDGSEIEISNTSQSIITLVVHQHYAPELYLSTSKGYYNPEGLCPRPPSVPGSVWRNGLPAPKPNPTATQARFCIVHHSAGSNTDTNYTNTVRNIFLYHTQTNGWDDIGYNFLIAKNGTIFDGRDPQGVTSQDNVQGAHFCAKNGGTMGTCLLGEFSTVPPFPQQLQSLEELLAWKISKDALGALDSAQHPIGLTGFPTLWLYRISGHRDGFDGSHCNTECPGDSTWAGLNILRYNVSERIKNCVISGLSENTANDLMVYPNPAKNILEIKNEQTIGFVVIMNQMGQTVLRQWVAANAAQIDISNFSAGIYYLSVSGHYKKLIVQNY